MGTKVKTAVKVGSLELANPVLAASGTFGYGREFAKYLDLNRLGGVVTKGLSLEPRDGNPPPRIVETAAGMLNAIGLANVGAEVFLEEKLPFLAALDCKVVVNLYAEGIDQFAGLAERLRGAEGIDALEINVSCPNVKGGGVAFGVDPISVAAVTRAVRENSDLPVWVKLTPNVTDPVPIALAAQKAGAEALSLINTIMGMAIDARRRTPRLANVMGGLSGPAIKPVGLRMVHLVSRAVDIPVVGLGGIMTGEDAAEYLLAGATAVQVGTASFGDPSSCQRVADELAQFCAQEGVADVNELVGALKT